MAIQKTNPDVFIIESLSVDDERHGRYEGRILSNILRLSGKNPKYFYIQKQDELKHVVKLFELSNYRFLHISCHGTDNSVMIGENTLTYTDFCNYFSKTLKLKRLFLSACELGNELFSSVMAGAKNKGMHSIVAPAQKVRFDEAAAIWAAFYVSSFAYSQVEMKSDGMLTRIRTLCSLFPVDFHVSTYRSAPNDEWKHQTVKSQDNF